MKRMLHAVSLFLVATLIPSAAAWGQDCSVPVLRRGPDGFSLRMEAVPAGQSGVLIRGAEERVITVIVPVSAGVSGDVVRGTEDEVLVIRCDEDQIRVLSGPAGGGSVEEVMAAPKDAFHRYALRVNALGEDGERAAFWVRDGSTGPDNGPVIDMFRGMVPLEEGDVSVTTEVAEPASSAPSGIAGVVSLRALGPYTGVAVTFPDGRTGHFILDLGASRSVVYRHLLPEGTPVNRMVAVEHTAEGTREVGAHAQGAGGTASAISSVAQLEWVMVGDVRVEGFEPLVLDEPFLVEGRPIDGVLGLDVLRRAGRIAADFGRPGGPSVLELGGDPVSGAVEIPLQEVRGLLFADGTLGEVSALLLLDSGARLSVVPQSLARRASWRLSDTPVDSLRGADGTPLAMHDAATPPLRLGHWTPPSTPFVAGPLPILDNLGLSRDSGILGQPFWQAVGRVQVDFRDRVLRVPGG